MGSNATETGQVWIRKGQSWRWAITWGSGWLRSPGQEKSWLGWEAALLRARSKRDFHKEGWGITGKDLCLWSPRRLKEVLVWGRFPAVELSLYTSASQTSGTWKSWLLLWNSMAIWRAIDWFLGLPRRNNFGVFRTLCCDRKTYIIRSNEAQQRPQETRVAALCTDCTTLPCLVIVQYRQASQDVKSLTSVAVKLLVASAHLKMAEQWRSLRSPWTPSSSMYFGSA